MGGEARLIGVGGGGVRGWPGPEERYTRPPDSGSGHTPPRGKAKGAGGLEAFIKYVYWHVMCTWYRYLIMFGTEKENKKLAHSLTLRSSQGEIHVTGLAAGAVPGRAHRQSAPPHRLRGVHVN